MEYTRNVALGVFLGLIVLGVGALLGSGMMATDTVLMMVLPSMAIYGALNMYVGTRYGEYRATTELP